VGDQSLERLAQPVVVGIAERQQRATVWLRRIGDFGAVSLDPRRLRGQELGVNHLALGSSLVLATKLVGVIEGFGETASPTSPGAW
jgi:hypothetical protein